MSYYPEQAILDDPTSHRAKFWRKVLDYRRQRLLRVSCMRYDGLFAIDVASRFFEHPETSARTLEKGCAEAENFINQLLE